MSHLREHLEHLHKALTEVETHARKLPNHNFADIVASSHRKLAQVMTHPDLDAVHEHASKARVAETTETAAKEKTFAEAAAAGAMFPST